MRSSILPILLALSLGAALTSCAGKEQPRRLPAESLQPASPLAGVNWVDSVSRWTPHVDEFGSAVDTVAGFARDGRLRVHFTLARRATELWPFIELIFDSPASLEGVYGVKLTYKCDQPLIVKIGQTDFGPKPEGNETYSLYQNMAPTSKEWSTIKLRFADFVFPQWVPDISKDIPLDLTKSRRLYFTPGLDATYGGNTLLEIRELEFLQ